MSNQNEQSVSAETLEVVATDQPHPWTHRGTFLLVGFIILMVVAACLEVVLMMFHPGNI